MRMRRYEDLLVWQKAMQLAKIVYLLQKGLPKEEMYGLGDQIRRAVVSVPSNIAEGSSRDSEIDFCHFLEIALGSAFEVEAQLTIAKNQNYLTLEQFNKAFDELTQLQLGLGLFIKNIRKTSPKKRNRITS